MNTATAAIILNIYGVLLLVGGVMGYVKAKSSMSLIMGIVTGILVLAGVYLSHQNFKLGFGIVTATSLLLIGVFSMRFIKTKAFMPSGMLLAMSLIAAVISFYSLYRSQ
jgi:uncharacterized membrane protein (UPF0136 family)